ILLSRKVQQRLRPVAETMDLVAGGNLTARIPRQNSNDDLDRLSGTINDALDRLKLLVDGMRQVTTDIAHDLKTPLNRLSIIIEEASREQEVSKAVSGKLEAARLECENINQTFEALLRIAQIEASAHNNSHFTPIDLATLIETVADIYSDVAIDAGMTLSVKPSSGPVSIKGDERLLTQMLVNLVENAIRHCPADTAITIDTHLEQGRPIISVADNGSGIPASERQNVLRRLYRLEQSRTTSGNGLGLALVKAVADFHDAGIQLMDSEPENRAMPGLTIEITFPSKAGQQ
ncbi:MAG: HAMP domain-containing sensor histidine kinase, partial [Hyphomicrobiales bacterium]